MSSFKLDRTIISLIHHETISFQMFRVEYLISYTEFSMAMWLIDVEYIHTESYSQLHVDLPVHWVLIRSRPRHFETVRHVCGTSKASVLGCPAFRYLHTIVSRCWMGERPHGDREPPWLVLFVEHSILLADSHKSPSSLLVESFVLGTRRGNHIPWSLHH